MPPQVILGYIGLVLATLGGIWGIVKLLLLRDRKNVDDQQKAMWSKLDAMRTDLSEAQRELDVLKERVRGLPDRSVFDALEEKLERKLETLAKQFLEVVQQAANKFRCPHDTGS